MIVALTLLVPILHIGFGICLVMRGVAMLLELLLELL